MEIIKYPDGSSYVKADTELIGNINYEFIHKINSYEDLWHLNQRVDAFWNLNKQKPIIIIPNLIDAQADRRFNSNESFGLKLVCDFLNRMNADFKIFHPHNSEVVEALIDNVEIIDNSEFILQTLLKLDKSNNIKEIYKPLLKRELYKSIDNLILMSSDAGGFKPLIKLCDKINWKGEVASASKAREYKNGKTILTQLIAHNDFKGKDILIIDDICVYGGTFKGLSKLLRERNCGKLYLAISHMTVQNLSEDPVTNYFDKVFTTNSKYDNYSYRNKSGGISHENPQNLQIIKLF